MLSERTIPEARLAKFLPADGESLADWALCFGVGGLLYQKIKSRGVPTEFIPVEAGNKLREAYRNLAIRNARLFFEASKVLQSLSDHQVPVIALKGLSLAKNIYGDIALRPMSDLDLLVKEEDLVRAGRILLTLGYQQYFSTWESTLKASYHLPPFTNKSETMIELHWNIVPPDSPIRLDLDGLWERARPFKIDHVEVLAFSPEDLLLHLCIHACKHFRTGMDLIPLCDIAGLIRTSADTIDWQIVMDRAVRWSGRKCVYLMLLVVRELLGTAPSDHIMSEMKPDDYRSAFLDEALDQIIDVSRSGQLIGRRIGGLLEIKTMRGMKSRVRALLKIAFPSRENMTRMYPVAATSPKIYLCYLLRVGRKVVHLASVMLRLFRRDRSVIKAVHQAVRVSAVSDWMFS